MRKRPETTTDMNYNTTYRPGFSWTKVLLPFLFIVAVIFAAHLVGRKAGKKAAEAKQSTQELAGNSTRVFIQNIDQEIKQHYEKADSLTFVRDSLIYEQIAAINDLKLLQQQVDSVFNRQPYLPHPSRSGERPER